MSVCSKLDNIRCVEISLLIGAVCGATALGIISLHLGRYGKLSLSSMKGIGYARCSAAWLGVIGELLRES